MPDKNGPRKVQAPRARPEQRAAGAQDGDRNRRRTLNLVAVAGAAMVALAAVVFFVSRGGGGAETVAEAMRKAGCTYQTAQGLEALHVAETAKPKWNTDPPSSGPHYGVAALFNFYEEPVDLIRVVHNLEHGGVVVLYGRAVDDAVLARLRSWWNDDANGVVVAELPRLGSDITLAAWIGRGPQSRGHLARCSTFDEDAFSTFRAELRARGPEPFPLEALAPGN